MLKIFKYAFFARSFIRSNQGRYRLRKWSRAVIKRDGGCVICGSKHNLEAHHLNDKSTYPSMALRLNNGVTLCRKHHIGFHKSMGGFDKSCTYKDFIRYKKKFKKGFWFWLKKLF